MSPYQSTTIYSKLTRIFSEELEAQIRDYIKTIDRLKEYERESREENAQPVHVRKDNRLQEALVELGTSMAEEGHVPQVERQSFSSSSTGQSSRRSRSYVSASTTSTAPTTPAGTESHRSILPTVPPANLHPSPLQIRNDHHRTPPGNGTEVQPTQPDSYIPSLRRKQRRIEGLPAMSDPVSSGPSHTQMIAGPSEQVDYTSVRPTSNYLQYFNGSGSMQSVSGYVVANGQHVPTTANVDPEIPQNLISIAYAAQLGLTIQPHETADGDGSPEVTITLPGGEERKSSGEVVFQWSAGSSSHKPPFNVRCLVYEHGIRNLVLGRLFLDQRHRYWNGGEDDDGGEWMR